MATNKAARLGPVALGNAAALMTWENEDGTTYTAVPVGKVLYIKSINVVNTTTSDKKVYMSIGVDAAATRIISGSPVHAEGDYNKDVWIPVFAGEEIYAYGDVAGLTHTVGAVEVTP